MPFRSSRVARKRRESTLINIQAVDKQIKPCYLWDVSSADISKILEDLGELYSLGQTESSLSAFSVDDTVFVTNYEYLKTFLNNFCSDDFDVINVSRTNSEPSLLPSEDKWAALSPVVEKVESLLCDLQTREPLSMDINSILQSSGEDLKLNLTTLFGFLVGYPILYWYVPQPRDMDFECLSMEPLKRYLVTSGNYKEKAHELFSFTVPQKIADQTEQTVDNWFGRLRLKCENCRFGQVELFQNTEMSSCFSL